MGRNGATYSPFPFVDSIRTTAAFLSAFTTDTLAPTISPPDLSLTVPTIEPAISCAEAIAPQTHRDTNTQSTKKFLLMTPPLVLESISPPAGADGSSKHVPDILPAKCGVKFLKRFCCCRFSAGSSLSFFRDPGSRICRRASLPQAPMGCLPQLFRRSLAANRGSGHASSKSNHLWQARRECEPQAQTRH